MKTNKNFATFYMGVSLIWCIFLVCFTFSPQAIQRGGMIFIGGALFVLVAAICVDYPKGSGKLTAGAIIMSILLVLAYPMFRFFASESYDHLKALEECFRVALRPAGAPENFPIINGTLILFTVLGLLHIMVSFLYWLKVIRKRPKTPTSYAWRFYFTSFFSLTRLLFLCIPLLLIVLVGYMHEVYGYRGIGCNDGGIYVLIASYFFFNPFTPRKLRGLVAVAFLSFLTLAFLSVKNYEYMLFSMRSSLDITSESLVTYEKFKDIIPLHGYMKMFLSLPEYRGNVLLFMVSDQAPDPFSWKDFILIIPIGLYMLLNVIFEPQLKPPVAPEKLSVGETAEV